MKKLIFLFLLAAGYSADACDACGCSSSGNFSGLMPQFSRKFIGIRYRQASYRVDPSQLQGLHDHADQQLHHESYVKAEFWARFYPAPKLQLMMFLPYGFHSKEENGVKQQISSVGDASLLLHYVLVNNSDSLHSAWKHTLLAGGGIKLPTGRYQQRDADLTMFQQGFQVGSGAYSYILNAIYTTQYNRAGFNADVSYRINRKNELDYQLGNQASSSGTFFYRIRGKHFSILPNTGMFYEHIDRDRQYGADQVLSGGNFLYHTAGIECYLDRVSFGFNLQSPLSKQDPSSAPVSSHRVMASLNFVF
jgi:hypothetical protein